MRLECLLAATKTDAVMAVMACFESQMFLFFFRSKRIAYTLISMLEMWTGELSAGFDRLPSLSVRLRSDSEQM